VAPSGISGPFTLADENVIKDSLTKSGFGDVIIEKMNVTFTFLLKLLQVINGYSSFSSCNFSK
jgi:hypothetical protein